VLRFRRPLLPFGREHPTTPSPRPSGIRLGHLARLLTAAGVAVWLSVPAAATGPQQPRQQAQPTFRATVDLVAVDVQVVGPEGRPIPNLGAEKFEVSIDGKRRRVVSADFIRQDRQDLAASLSDAPPNSGSFTGRVFMLAVDVNSFSIGESRGVVTAARSFVQRLNPDDQVGVFAFPIGVRLAPTTDHYAAMTRLDTIVGQKQALKSDYSLSPAEVVDITAETAATNASFGRGTPTNNIVPINPSSVLQRVAQRECGGTNDLACLAGIRLEAQAMSFFYEGEVTEAMNGLGGLIRDLSILPGRKTVVVLSAGMTASDRPGGRPSVDELATGLGRTAAEHNTTVYAVHVDSSGVASYAPEKRRSDKNPISRERESVMVGHLLDVFSAASGGAFIRVLVGSGESALDRVLLETSCHYLLGVEPADADRGRLRQLRVRVTEPGVTVRSRLWVAVPKKRT